MSRVRQRLDLVFVLDSSGSIVDNFPPEPGTDNWVRMLDYLASLVRSLAVERDGVRVGLVRYSNTARSIFYLNSYFDKQELIRVLYRTQFTGGATNTSGALRETRLRQFTELRGDRPGVPNAVLLVTDGVSTHDTARTIPEARRLHDQGVKVFVVGITSSVDQVEIKEISSQPQQLDQNYFYSTQFTNLQNGILDGVLRQLCDVNARQILTTLNPTSSFAVRTTTSAPTSAPPATTVPPVATGNKRHGMRETLRLQLQLSFRPFFPIFFGTANNYRRYFHWYTEFTYSEFRTFHIFLHFVFI